MIEPGYQTQNTYRVVETIATGQIGIVVKIRDKNGSDFALKIIKPHIIKNDPCRNAVKLIRGIQREADFLRAFRHENIVQLKETIQDPTLGFGIIMEYAPGGTLKEQIRKKNERIEKSSIEKLVVTDSIPNVKESPKIEVLSVAKLFAETIDSVYHNESISTGFVF